MSFGMAQGPYAHVNKTEDVNIYIDMSTLENGYEALQTPCRNKHKM